MKASLYLDTRYKLKAGNFPVKVQISTKEGGRWRQVYFPTGESATENEFAAVKSGKVRGKLRLKREAILAKEAKALDIIKNSPFISLATFKALFTSTHAGKGLNVQGMYEQIIAKLQERGQYGTSMIYQHASKMLLNKYGPDLILPAIDKDFLQDLEASLTIASATIGMYLRTLRRVYNVAIDKKLISRDLYPFGPRQYVIPSGKGLKRALTEKEKNSLVNYKPRSPQEKAALQVWIFSYYCNGMNIADIARLTAASIHGNLLVYIRKKTAKTERTSRQQVVVIRKEVASLLKDKTDRIFPVLDGKETPEQERKKVVQWGKTTNKYLKRIGQRLKFSIKLTTYTARHTAATMLLRAGADLIYIKNALGHSSVTTTEQYLASLDLTQQKAMTAKL